MKETRRGGEEVEDVSAAAKDLEKVGSVDKVEEMRDVVVR